MKLRLPKIDGQKFARSLVVELAEDYCRLAQKRVEAVSLPML